MKRLFRASGVQTMLAVLLAAYLKLTLRTLRWRHEGRERAEAVWAEGGGVIVCFWHGRIGLSPACWPLERAQEPRALVSLSPDGQFIASAVERLGFPAIRGSSAKPGDPAKAKGGASAMRDVLRWLAGGGGVAITPDGPRGPAGVMAAGTPLLAKASGAPVLLVGLAARPALRFKSWDRTMLPLPFGRGAIVWGGPFRIDRRIDAETLETSRLEWAVALTALTARAEAMVE